MNDLYHDVILDELDNPQNVGELTDATHQAATRNASCGDVIKVELILSDDQTIEQIKWQGEGCAISQAAMSLLSEEVKGYSTKQLQELNLESLQKLMGLSTISQGRIKCLELGLKALLLALEKQELDE